MTTEPPATPAPAPSPIQLTPAEAKNIAQHLAAFLKSEAAEATSIWNTYKLVIMIVLGAIMFVAVAYALHPANRGKFVGTSLMSMQTGGEYQSCTTMNAKLEDLQDNVGKIVAFVNEVAPMMTEEKAPPAAAPAATLPAPAAPAPAPVHHKKKPAATTWGWW